MFINKDNPPQVRNFYGRVVSHRIMVLQEFGEDRFWKMGYYQESISNYPEVKPMYVDDAGFEIEGAVAWTELQVRKER